MTKKEAIRVAKQHAEFRSFPYAVVRMGKKYGVVTKQSALLNGMRIVFSTDEK